MTDIKTRKPILVSTGSASLATESEYRRLVESLKWAEKEFKIAKEAINFETLKQIIAKKPKMIHISCHGAYSEQDKEFYI